MARVAQVLAGVGLGCVLLAGCSSGPPAVTAPTANTSTTTATPTAPSTETPPPTTAPTSGHSASTSSPRASAATCGQVGCHPPKDRCSAVWVKALVARAALPTTPSLRTRACRGGWLVLDISAKAPGCVSMGGDATLPGCGPATHLRWFARSAPAGWQLVASGGGSGCADVHAAVPSFPTALCRSLPQLVR